MPVRCSMAASNRWPMYWASSSAVVLLTGKSTQSPRGKTQRRPSGVKTASTSRSPAVTRISGCAGRQQDVVVELVGDRLQLVAEGDEVDHVLVFVERAFDFHGHAIVVAVQPLAHVAVERDEMGGAEDVLLFFEADAST